MKKLFAVFAILLAIGTTSVFAKGKSKSIAIGAQVGYPLGGALTFKVKTVPCIFALNFNPTSSFGDYGFSAPAGEYGLVFSTDDATYNGQGRLSAAEKHFSMDQKCPNGNQEFDHTLYLYLPSRCAVVLKKIK